jgi:putative selenate reductase
VKLTNTLVVANKRGVMPGEQMYLSGKRLHVLATAVLDKLMDALPGVFALGPEPGPVPVAFSAGIDKDNLTEAVALGLRPVTICSDLLKPGGYGRMAQGLRKLGKTMKDLGVGDLPGLEAHAHQTAVDAGHRDAVAALKAHHTTPEGSARYTLEATGKPLRQVDHVLEMFDCVDCTNCVTVCPNDAFLKTPTGGMEGLEARSQYLVLTELCNECGNCVTFCPEEGEPFRVKPRLYTEEAAWAAEGRSGYLLGRKMDQVTVQGPDRAAAERIRVLAAGENWLAGSATKKD